MNTRTFNKFSPRLAHRAHAHILVLGLGLLALVPLGLLALGSLAQGWYWPALLPREWSWRAWQYVLAPSSAVSSAFFTSFGIAGVVTLLALLIAFPAARVLAWQEFRGKRIVMFCLLLPVLAPPLAALMGLHALFLHIGLAETWLGVTLAHLIPAVPYATLMLLGSFTRFDADFEAQARTLGASRWAVLRHVTLPALAPGLAVAAGFAFLISWGQYLATALLGGGRINTLPLTLVAFQRGGDEAVTAALSLLFVAPALLVALLALRKKQDQ